MFTFLRRFTFRAACVLWLASLSLALGQQQPEANDPAERDRDTRERVQRLRGLQKQIQQKRSEARLKAALEDRTQLEFIEAPLEDVLSFLQDHHDIPIQIDVRALEDVGIGIDAPITRSLKGVSLRSALRLMLRDLELTYLIRDEVLMITTPEAAEHSYQQVRIYPVSDLVGKGEDASVEALSQAAYVAIGGDLNKSAFQIAAFDGRLVVRAAVDQHRELEDLLGKLRMQAFADGKHPLEGWTAGSQVSFAGVRMTDQELAHLARQTHLQGLDLGDCELSNLSLRWLKDLQQLRTLDLSGNRLNDVGLEALKGLGQLVELNLSGNRIRGPGLKQFAPAKLEILDCSQSLEMQDWSWLGRLSQLRTLRANGSSLKDQDLDALQKLPHLETLVLGQTNLTEAGLQKLAALKQLRTLQLEVASDNPKQLATLQRAAQTLQDALPSCKVHFQCRLIRDPFGGAAAGEDPFAPAAADPFGGDVDANPFQ